MKISVILLAHNEESGIGSMIQGLIELYSDTILEIIVVDDASIDRTATIVKDLSLCYPQVRLISKTPPCGVGYALKRGLSQVNPAADYILSMDSDFIDSLSEAKLLIQEAEKGSEAIVGSRFLKKSRLIGYRKGKWLANRFYHFACCLLLGISQCDITNNFKLYKYSLFKRLPLRSNGFAVNAETGILPHLYGVRVTEVPVTWSERSKGMGQSKFRVLEVWFDYAASLWWCIWLKFGIIARGFFR